MKQLYFILMMLMLVIGCDKEEISSLQADSFIKFYSTHSFFTSADAKQTNNGGYAVLGTVETLTKGSQICFLRTDKYGNSIDSARYYGRDFDDRAYCLQVLPDGYAILGSSENPQSGKLEVYFIRTDPIGDTLWTRTIGGSEDIEAYYFEVTSDGSYIMTGYTLSFESPFDKEIWLYAIDENGDDLWPSQRTYGGDRDEEGRCLQIMDDGRIAITGSTRSWPATSVSESPFVLITNSIGIGVNLIQFPVDDSPTDEEANCIRKLDDTNFLLVGSIRNSGTGMDIIIRKVTPMQPGEKWSWGTDGDDTGKSLIVEGNKLFILGTLSAAGGNSSISLIRTDLSGNGLVYTDFGQGSQMTASSFIKTLDNGFIITGSNKHSDTQASVILIKTKADGAL